MGRQALAVASSALITGSVYWASAGLVPGVFPADPGTPAPLVITATDASVESNRTWSRIVIA